jgi:DNA-binding phage protein
MNPVEAVNTVREAEEMSVKELAEYSGACTRESLFRILSYGNKDMKVSTLVNLMETMGYQIVAQNVENPDREDIVIDNG